MEHVNLPPSRRSPGRQWTLLDLVSVSFFAAVLVFCVLVFTSLGSTLFASGRRVLAGSSPSEPRLGERLLALLDRGGHRLLAPAAIIDACPAEEVEHMPCEDPRRSNQLSRHMNFYRERHCPLPEESLLCLIPRPKATAFPSPCPRVFTRFGMTTCHVVKLQKEKVIRAG